MISIEYIISNLGLNGKDGLFFMADEQWKKDTAFPNRVKRLIERKIQPAALFCFDNKPLILFFENPSNKQELHEAIWNFNESPIAIIIENDSVEIFNGFTFLKEKKMLEKLGGVEKLNDFNYFELVTGKTWGQYGDHLNYKNRVDYFLLQNINAARKVLVQDLDSKIANALIGKVIFVRYLIDRKVKLCFEDTSKYWSNKDFCDLLDSPQRVKSFFDYLEDSKKGFNGDLFPISENEYNQISTENYQVIKRLLQGEDLDKQQPSLFEFYDFSIIPIEFISNVYELFIGKENQEDEGAYYTPLFLVDYILKETVERKLSGNDGYDCKVLDPACGSGIFLVETLRKIIEKYISTGVEIKSDEFKEAIKELAKENIYGVDKDLSAVQVAIFSIYLTLLDYLEPPEIETFKFPILFNKNFFEADFFDTQAAFNECFGKLDFTYILGNPPWKRGKGEKEKPLYIKYIESRKKKEKAKDIPLADIGNKEIAQAFLLRSSDFSKNTKCALIVTSKTLYNLQSDTFRRYFLHNFLIERVFELAPVRKEVFDKSNDKAIAPACVLFFSHANGESTDLNMIEHISLKPSRFFSLFKIFTINKTDYKRVQQSKLKQHDWLWKVLVYGSFLDFNLIKRLKDNYCSIKEIIDNEEFFLVGQGIMVGGGDQNDASKLVGRTFIDTRSDIKRYWINPNNNKEWKLSFVHRVRNVKLYEAPVLLITEGFKNDLKSVSAISYTDAVYKSSLTGIKGKNNTTIDILRRISGILNSSFFSYYNLMTFSSSGIEREQSHDEEKWNLPYSENTSLPLEIDKLEQILLTKYARMFSDCEIEASEKDQLKKIDETIQEMFCISSQETDLMDYAHSVVIPIIMKHDGFERLFLPINHNDIILESYASLFVKRFKSKLDNSKRKFVVEIWHTKQIIGMFFKMIPVTEYKKSVIWIKKQDDAAILTLLSKIGTERITDKLFVQKDIRGFDNNGEDFYIIKPNEQRLWHKAIGYLDVDEFADAIITAGRGDQ